MQRIWTSVSSAIVLIAMAVIVCVTPTDFVIWAPGESTDLLGSQSGTPIIMIANGEAHAASGEILATSMVQTSQTARVTLPNVVANYFKPNHAVLPRGAVYSPGRTQTETTDTLRQTIESSREQAVAAGVRQAGITVEEHPKLLAVRQNGPSYNLLFPGDYILAIDTEPMSTPSDMVAYIRGQKQVGDLVVVTVQRPGDTEPQQVTIPGLAGTSTNNLIPTLGTTPGPGYLYTPSVTVTMDVDSSDPSQGLAIALATVDLLTEEDNTAGQLVAATGVISYDEDVTHVTRVDGINEHAMSAMNSLATMLLIPQDNCADLTESFFGMDIVPVSTLHDALDAVRDHSTGAPLPHC